jgi:hypothetical protein
MLGNLGQGLAAAVLKHMGYTVLAEEEECSIADGLISGHLDGELTGLDLEDEVVVWDSKLRNIWGLFGTKKSFGLVTHGLPYASQEIYLQLQSYMLARQRERAIITAHPFDMSVTKQQAAIKKMEALPAYRLVMEADEEAQQLAIQRGQLVAVAANLGLSVTAEYSPAVDSYPCDYCEWKARCMVQGPAGEITLPPIPAKYKNPTVNDWNLSEVA